MLPTLQLSLPRQNWRTWTYSIKVREGRGGRVRAITRGGEKSGRFRERGEGGKWSLVRGHEGIERRELLRLQNCCI